MIQIPTSMPIKRYKAYKNKQGQKVCARGKKPCQRNYYGHIMTTCINKRQTCDKVKWSPTINPWVYFVSTILPSLVPRGSNYLQNIQNPIYRNAYKIWLKEDWPGIKNQFSDILRTEKPIIEFVEEVSGNDFEGNQQQEFKRMLGHGPHKEQQGPELVFVDEQSEPVAPIKYCEDGYTKAQIVALAKKAGIVGYRGYNKDELCDLLSIPHRGSIGQGLSGGFDGGPRLLYR